MQEATGLAEACGYVRAHRAVISTCGIEAAVLYGFLEDYERMGEGSGRGCFPSHSRLARDMRCGERSVARYLNTLRLGGFVAWQYGSDGRVNRYHLLFKALPNWQWSDEAPLPNWQALTITTAKLAVVGEESAANLAVVGGGIGGASLSTKQDNESPYGLFAAMCEAAGLDISAFSRGDKSRYLGVIKRLTADQGLTTGEMRACAAWLHNQSWRDKPVDVFDIKKHLGTWRAAGRPTREPARRPTSQADHNRGGTGKVVV